RLEEVLRLEVMFIGEVVHGEVEVYQLPDTLPHVEVEYVQPGRANRCIRAVEPVVACVAVAEVAEEAPIIRDRHPTVAHQMRRAINIDARTCAAKEGIRHLRQPAVD